MCMNQIPISSTGSSYVHILSIPLVCVKAENANAITKICLFLDPGSTCTFWTMAMIGQLNLSAKENEFVLSTTNSDKQLKVYVLSDLKVCGLHWSQTYFCFSNFYIQTKTPADAKKINKNSSLKGHWFQKLSLIGSDKRTNLVWAENEPQTYFQQINQIKMLNIFADKVLK